MNTNANQRYRRVQRRMNAAFYYGAAGLLILTFPGFLPEWLGWATIGMAAGILLVVADQE